MLKLTSRFILEVLPYLLAVLIAAILVPALLYSLITVAQPGVLNPLAYEMEAMVMPNVSGRDENALELIRQDHDAFAPDQMLLHGLAKEAEDKLVIR